MADALNCRQHTDSNHLKELANSFSHDILNIAALAGRLLWYEGVTPEIWRSHDLIAVGIDAEGYCVMLQSACDIMADVVATLGAKKGQAPWESFHRLTEWASRNRTRLDPAYHLVAKDLPWFHEINTMRTGIVHRGKTMLVYTDRVTFNWGKLIPSFKDLTRSMLDFSESLGSIVLSQEDRQKNPKKTIIDGVYVPALRHLLDEYTVPSHSDSLKQAAQCLLACGGYVEAANIGYPSGFWWNFLVSVAAKMSTQIVSASIPVNAGGTVHESKFVMSDKQERYGLVVWDVGRVEPDWLNGAAASAAKLQAQFETSRTSCIVRKMKGSPPQFLPGTRFLLIVGDDRSVVVDQYVSGMRY